MGDEPEPATAFDFDAARGAVSQVAVHTPLLEAPGLTARVGRPVLLKLECLQTTGSFKVRGAAARLSALDDGERQRGVITCSSGNHGRAVAFVAERLGVPAAIYVPEWVDPVKLAGIRSHGADAVLAGATYDEAEAAAMAAAEDQGRTYVSAFDDPWIIAGQGTVALEILDDLDDPPAAILAALSGGGLVGGIAAALRSRLGDRSPPAVAVTAEKAGVMLASLVAGHPVELEEEETVASALAGGIGLDNQHSFPLVRDLITQHVVVTEDEIKDAMTMAHNDLHLMVEGGGAAALAALHAERWAPDSEIPGPVVVVVSGGNVSLTTLQQVVEERRAGS